MQRIVMLAVGLCCVAGATQAQSVYRWVDQGGKVHFSDRPPPATVKNVQEKKLTAPAADKQLPFALRQASENFPVILHVAAECPVCERGREYLRRRGVPFTERVVASNEEIESLRERLGVSELSVPVLQVGERLTMGYLETAWAGLLDAAGYPNPPGSSGASMDRRH